MRRCGYAFDKNDEYCKECNGLEMMVNGEKYPCTDCSGYTPGDEIPEDSENSNFSMNEPVEDSTKKDESEINDSSEKVSNVNTSSNDEEKQASDENKEPADVSSEKSDVKVVKTEKSSEEITLPDGVTVTSMRYMSGATVMKGDSYYKFSAEEEWSVDESVSSNTEKVQDIRDCLWAKLNLEIDNQLDELYNE